jgi:sterol O-acyltransferase
VIPFVTIPFIPISHFPSFADRGFYEDWVPCLFFEYVLLGTDADHLQWNSTSWDEFSRKWNKPVHNFLLRHVYASTITSYQLSRSRAMLVTFLISAAAHELVMAVVTKKIRYAFTLPSLTLRMPRLLTTKYGRMYLFAMQLIQIPLIAVGRTSVIKRNNLLGNSVFWLGLYAGFPLLCVAYVLY